MRRRRCGRGTTAHPVVPCLDQYVQSRPFNQYRVPDIGRERVDAFMLPDPDDRQDDRRTLRGQRGRFGQEEPASVIAATMSQHHPQRDRLRHRQHHSGDSLDPRTGREVHLPPEKIAVRTLC